MLVATEISSTAEFSTLFERLCTFICLWGGYFEGPYVKIELQAGTIVRLQRPGQCGRFHRATRAFKAVFTVIILHSIRVAVFIRSVKVYSFCKKRTTYCGLRFFYQCHLQATFNAIYKLHCLGRVGASLDHFAKHRIDRTGKRAIFMKYRFTVATIVNF